MKLIQLKKLAQQYKLPCYSFLPKNELQIYIQLSIQQLIPECPICFNQTDASFICDKCYFCVCSSYSSKILKCPQCRSPRKIPHVRIERKNGEIHELTDEFCEFLNVQCPMLKDDIDNAILQNMHFLRLLIQLGI